MANKIARRRRRSRSLPSRSQSRTASQEEDGDFLEEEEYDSPPSPQLIPSLNKQIPNSSSPASRRRWTLDFDSHDDKVGKVSHSSSSSDKNKEKILLRLDGSVNSEHYRNRSLDSGFYSSKDEPIIIRSTSSNALPEWLFEVSDDDHHDTLLNELGIHPKRFLKKVIWVLIWAWLPRGEKWEKKVSSLSRFGATLNPSILASSEDFWGSFLNIIFYGTSHYNRGQFRVLPWVILIWVLGSAFLRFIILAREQAHRSDMLDIVRIHRASLQLPAHLGGSGLVSNTNEIIPFKGSGISLVECLSATGFAIIPLTLTVLAMGLLNPRRTFCYLLEFIGVAWSSRSVSVALRTRTRPPIDKSNSSSSFIRTKEQGEEEESNSLLLSTSDDPLAEMNFSEYFKEGHRQDHLLLLFPIVLLNVYFVSLYTRN